MCARIHMLRTMAITHMQFSLLFRVHRAIKTCLLFAITTHCTIQRVKLRNITHQIVCIILIRTRAMLNAMIQCKSKRTHSLIPNNNSKARHIEASF